ncbi:hypothetical protein FACS18949_13050 [Clostridia bacterium]|nr:hypothetical protein FACS189425_04270 [Clostridia bacterium]GHV35319.1 hypothetical protein FACS18949_13050 [Clostridia bacterium]
MNTNYDEVMFDAMLGVACKEFDERQQKEIPESIDYEFSPEFERKMRSLLGKHRRKARSALSQRLRVALLRP